MERCRKSPALWLFFLSIGVALGSQAIGLPRAWGADETKKAQPDDYELFQIFVDTLDQIERNYVKDISRRELMDAAIGGILTKLDPYSNYIKPEELGGFKTSVENQFGGIGIRIAVDPRTRDANGRLKIATPIVGTPAYRAGLETGDSILEIDGKSTDTLRTEDDAIKLLKGEAGSKVELKVRHARNSEVETVTLTREMVHVETVLGDVRKDDDSWEFMLDKDQHIGYIRITQFSRETTADLKKALKDLETQGVKGVVLDLRFNPGGLLSSAIETCDLFVSEGRIVSTKGRNTPEKVWDARREGTFDDFLMVVLVNDTSASASEIVSACLQDHARAKIVGERTWGKGSVQNVIDLEGGKSALKLTTASYHRPNGKNIHRAPGAKESDEWGVLPDEGFEVKLTREQKFAYQTYRRDRDILAPKPRIIAAVAPGEAKLEPAGSEKPAASEDQPDKPVQPEKTEPETTVTPEADPAPSEARPAAPARRGGRGGPVTPPAQADSRGPIRREFVDTQLKKALDYLTAEIAKPDKPSDEGK